MAIRRALKTDIPSIRRVAMAAYDKYIYNLYVKDEIDLAFDKFSPYDLKMFVATNENLKIVAFGAVGRSMFMNNVFELRLAATHPKHINNGYYRQITETRLEYIKNASKGLGALVQVSTKIPQVYEGFIDVFTNNLGYHCLQKII